MVIQNTPIDTGWWFGPFFIFPYIENSNHNWLIFFQRVSNHQPETHPLIPLESHRNSSMGLPSDTVDMICALDSVTYDQFSVFSQGQETRGFAFFRRVYILLLLQLGKCNHDSLGITSVSGLLLHSHSSHLSISGNMCPVIEESVIEAMDIQL